MEQNIKLLSVLRKKNLTQQAIANQIKMNQSIFSMIVRGRYNPDDDQKSKIAKALKVSVKEVF